MSKTKTKQKMNRAAYKEHCWGLAFVAPPFIGFCIFMAFPIVFALIASMTKWNGMNSMLDNFVGFQNYAKLLTDAKFWKVLGNTIVYMLGIPIGMALAMLIAVGMNRKMRGIKILRTLYYVPVVSSLVAVAILWMWVFNYDYGLLNQIVKAFGGENVRWLGTDLIFWAMMIAFIFGSVGYYMLIFISGIEGIPQDLYEAATIDGANIFDRFFQITLPLLKGVIRTCVTFWSINATTFFLWTKMFSPINTETATIVPVVYLYDTVFGGKGVVERDAGAGAAIGVVLTLIIIVVYVITNLILKDSDLEY
mgnify:CR=1 FL=1